jgi:hypothetical protein
MSGQRRFGMTERRGVGRRNLTERVSRNRPGSTRPEGGYCTRTDSRGPCWPIPPRRGGDGHDTPSRRSPDASSSANPQNLRIWTGSPSVSKTTLCKTGVNGSESGEVCAGFGVAEVVSESTSRKLPGLVCFATKRRRHRSRFVGPTSTRTGAGPPAPAPVIAAGWRGGRGDGRLGGPTPSRRSSRPRRSPASPHRP